jgi:hypothetical protein
MGQGLAWARLLRLPNHFTAIADVLAGYLVVAGLTTEKDAVEVVSAWPKARPKRIIAIQVGGSGEI